MSSTQTLPEAPRTPTLAEVIKAAMDFRLHGVHVALPGRIESYDADTQSAEVKPMVQELLGKRDGSEVAESLAVIPNVPVVFPRGGGYFLTFPIKAGDFVLLVFNERSIDNWATGDGEEKNPDDLRMHSLTDAVAYPGFYPFQQALTDDGIDADMVLGKSGGSTIHIKDSGRVTVNGSEIHLGADDPTEFVALATKTLTEIQKVLNYVIAFTAFFNTHVHIVPGDPPKPTFVTPPAPSLTEPASSKVKAE